MLQQIHPREVEFNEKIQRFSALALRLSDCACRFGYGDTSPSPSLDPRTWRDPESATAFAEHEADFHLLLALAKELAVAAESRRLDATALVSLMNRKRSDAVVAAVGVVKSWEVPEWSVVSDDMYLLFKASGRPLEGFYLCEKRFDAMVILQHLRMEFEADGVEFEARSGHDSPGGYPAWFLQASNAMNSLGFAQFEASEVLDGPWDVDRYCERAWKPGDALRYTYAASKVINHIASRDADHAFDQGTTALSRDDAKLEAPDGLAADIRSLVLKFRGGQDETLTWGDPFGDPVSKAEEAAQLANCRELNACLERLTRMAVLAEKHGLDSGSLSSFIERPTKRSARDACNLLARLSIKVAATATHVPTLRMPVDGSAKKVVDVAAGSGNHVKARPLDVGRLTVGQRSVWDALAGHCLDCKALAQALSNDNQGIKEHVKGIRAKFGKQCIETKRGYGYFRPDAPPKWDDVKPRKGRQVRPR